MPHNEYPELTEKELEVRNVLYRFYRKHYTYDTSEKLRFAEAQFIIGLA
mgnify:CR=1 FL=1